MLQIIIGLVVGGIVAASALVLLAGVVVLWRILYGVSEEEDVLLALHRGGEI
jgi:hypothetical protein